MFQHSSRPFWVLTPTSSKRETCLCKVQDNLQFILDKLQTMGILRRVTMEKLGDTIVCSSNNKDCMCGLCEVCKDCRLDFQCSHIANGSDDASCDDCCNIVRPVLNHFDHNEVVTCHSWTAKTEHGDKKSVVMVKELHSLTACDLVDPFHSYLSRIRKHVYNIRHRYQQYRELRS